MEEELNYATVVFKNGGRPSKEMKEDSTTYSTVKLQEAATPEPKNKEEPTVYSTVKPQEAATPEPSGEAAAHTHQLRLMLVCLGILCVLLLAAVGAIIHMVMNEHKANEEMATLEANLSNLTAENQQLIVQRSILENRTEELRRDRANLNLTINIIMKFKTFPVSDFCPERKCQPCQRGWIRFQGKCYLFYNRDSPWMTWQKSQTYCQDIAADLVVIDSLQEQEFLSNHSMHYYDDYHGYWLGLQQTANNNWVWVDGREDTLRYWINKPFGSNGPKALLIPRKDPTANWDPAKAEMENRFICESEVWIWPI